MASKIFVHLKSSTAVCLPKMVDVRLQLYGLADSGEIIAALRGVIYFYFYTPFGCKNDRTKKVLLRNLWERVEKYYEERSLGEVREALDLVEDATDNEWTEDLHGAAEEAKIAARHELAEIRAFDRLLSKIETMIDMMCAKEGQVSEVLLRFIVDEIESADGSHQVDGRNR